MAHYLFERKMIVTILLSLVWNVSTILRQLFLVIGVQPLCPLKGNRLWDDQDLVSGDGFHCDGRWFVDPHLLRQFGQLRRPAHKALGVGQIGSQQHLLPLAADGFSLAVVDQRRR